MARVIGQFFGESDEMRGEWRIPNFRSLPKQVNEELFSPSIFFAGFCWKLVIYPNGQSRDHSEGHIGLRLLRTDFGPPMTISGKLGMRKADGTEMIIFEWNGLTFLRENDCYIHSVISRTSLENQKAELLPSETLTVICTLKNDRLLSTEDSLFSRLWNMSLRYWSILNGSKRTDFVLKLREGEKRVHRVILEERSPVFRRMLSTDMREAQTGEMDVSDLNPAAFNVVLAYIYSGDPVALSTDNVREVFKIAHLYELPQLARLCSRFMLEVLSVNTVCDVIALATLYEETEMLETAKDFLISNGNDVTKTEGWKSLKSEHPAIVSDLMESMLEKNLANVATSPQYSGNDSYLHPSLGYSLGYILPKLEALGDFLE